jgi:hypothetical protein
MSDTLYVVMEADYSTARPVGQTYWTEAEANAACATLQAASHAEARANPGAISDGYYVQPIPAPAPRILSLEEIWHEEERHPEDTLLARLDETAEAFFAADVFRPPPPSAFVPREMTLGEIQHLADTLAAPPPEGTPECCLTAEAKDFCVEPGVLAYDYDSRLDDNETVVFKTDVTHLTDAGFNVTVALWKSWGAAQWAKDQGRVGLGPEPWDPSDPTGLADRGMGRLSAREQAA